MSRDRPKAAQRPSRTKRGYNENWIKFKEHMIKKDNTLKGKDFHHEDNLKLNKKSKELKNSEDYLFAKQLQSDKIIPLASGDHKSLEAKRKPVNKRNHFLLNKLLRRQKKEK